jgi:hypothetical protein
MLLDPTEPHENVVCYAVTRTRNSTVRGLCLSLLKKQYLVNNHQRTQGRTQGQRRGAGLQTPKSPKTNLKNTDFVDSMIKVLHDFPFSRNQSLKSADD